MPHRAVAWYSLRVDGTELIMETLHYTRMDSMAGPLLIGVSAKGLVVLEFDRGRLPANPKTVRWEESQNATLAYVLQLREYFDGKRREFEFPLDLRGTDF